MIHQMLKFIQWFISYSFGLFRGHTASKSAESTQNDVTIEFAYKNYPKMTPQMLKSVQ